MGWTGGTDVFDGMVREISELDLPYEAQVRLLKALADLLEDQDWDTENESAYWDDPLVQEVMAELHPDWVEDEDDE